MIDDACLVCGEKRENFVVTDGGTECPHVAAAREENKPILEKWRAEWSR
jgi:hypothetical protein